MGENICKTYLRDQHPNGATAINGSFVQQLKSKLPASKAGKGLEWTQTRVASKHTAHAMPLVTGLPRRDAAFTRPTQITAGGKCW